MTGPANVVPGSDEILAAIAAVAREVLGRREPLAMDTSLVGDLGLDSIALVTLAAEIENRFRVRLEPEDEAAIATVGDLVRTLERKLSSDAATALTGGGAP